MSTQDGFHPFALLATDDDSRGPSPIYVRPPEELEGPRGSLCTQDRVMARSLPLLESSLSEQDVFTGAGPRPGMHRSLRGFLGPISLTLQDTLK